MAFSTTTLLIISLAITAAQIAVSLLFPRQQPQRPQPQQSTQPPPPNGTLNERQGVPPLRVICGRVRTAGDFATQEEKGGVAYDPIVHAAHRIEGYVQHWLHDELVTLNGSGYVTAPAHFQSKVRIEMRLGENAEAAWAALVSALPSIWTNDHRGDGLSQVLMSSASVDSQSYASVYPQGLPSHSCLIDGAWMFDPRDESHDPDDPSTWSFSRNLALIRLHHLTHPAGGRLKLSDMHLPSWAAAADVCDQTVVNRDEAEEPRYWGGISWKYRGDGQDPAAVGAKIDEAADLMVYSRGDGLVGVHAGAFVTPAIRLTKEHIKSISFDANQSPESTVLATRGRFTDPRNSWLKSDAAIYGDPYSGDDGTQRTATIDNEAVQSHNHMQRLQKLKFLRLNAPGVSIAIHYDEDVADVLEARWVTVHYPELGLDEAVVEIMEGVSLGLAPDNFSIAFKGIYLEGGDPYAFDAATEEGIPGGIVGPGEATGVPTPTGFDVVQSEEPLVGGGTAAFVTASWTHFDDTFTHELQYQPSDESQAPRSVHSNPGEDEVRTPTLADGVEYRFRLRAWSAGAPSPWTDYETTSATADPTPPDPPFAFDTTQISAGTIQVTWGQPNSPNLHHTTVYANTSAVFGSAIPIFTSYAGPGAAVEFLHVPGSPGDWYYWVESYNASGEPSGEVGPEVETVV